MLLIFDSNNYMQVKTFLQVLIHHSIFQYLESQILMNAQVNILKSIDQFIDIRRVAHYQG